MSKRRSGDESTSPRATLLPNTESKLDRVVRAVIHRISTGELGVGDRLPSVRQAEIEFDVARLTALAAYRRLGELGLVEVKPRSGFVVKPNPSVRSMRRTGERLDALYDEIATLLYQRGTRSVTATLRALAEVAAARARVEPELAFVECSAHQANLHADELGRLSGMHCLPLVLKRGAARLSVPRHVRSLITTTFHRAEVARIGRKDLAIHEVPLEISPEFVDDVTTSLRRRIDPRRIVFLGLRRHVIGPVVEDLCQAVGRDASRLRSAHIEEVASEDLDATLARVTRELRPAIVVLSSSLWDARPERVIGDPRIVPVRYRIARRAVGELLDAIGAPLAVPRRS